MKRNLKYLLILILISCTSNNNQLGSKTNAEITDNIFSLPQKWTETRTPTSTIQFTVQATQGSSVHLESPCCLVTDVPAVEETPDISLGNMFSTISLKTVIGHGRPLAAAYNPDHTLFAVTTETGLMIHSTKDWSIIGKYPFASFYGMEFSPDGRYLLLANDQTMKIIRVGTFELVCTLDIPHQWSGQRNKIWDISSDSDHVAIGIMDSINIFRISDQKHEMKIPHTKEITSLEYSPDGKYIAIGVDNYSVEIWDSVSGENIKILNGVIKTKGSALKNNINIASAVKGGPSTEIESLAFSADGAMVSGRVPGETVLVWRLDDENPLLRVESDTYADGFVQFIDGDSKILSVSNSFTGSNGGGWGSIRVWNIGDGSLDQEIQASSSSVSMSSDGDEIFHFAPNAIEIRQRKDQSLIAELPGYLKFVKAVRFLSDGSVFSSELFGAMEIWTRDGKLIRRVDGNPSIHARSMAMSVNAELFAAFNRMNDRVTVFQTSTDIQLFILEKNLTSGHLILLFSPNAKYLAASVEDITFVWSTINGALLYEFPSHERCLEYSYDSRYIATCDREGVVQIRELSDGIITQSIRTGTIDQMAFSKDGSMLAAECFDNIIRIWRVRDGAQVETMKIEGPVIEWRSLNILFTAADRLLVLGYENGDIFVICVDGTCQSKLGTLNGLSDIQPSPDGKYLITSSFLGIIQLWNFQIY